MKLAMKREALEKLNCLANEVTVDEAQSVPAGTRFGTVMEQSWPKCPTLHRVLPAWRKIFGLGLQADPSIAERCSQMT